MSFGFFLSKTHLLILLKKYAILFIYNPKKETIMLKIYKEYLPIQPNVPIYTNLQGELLNIEEQGNHLVIYFNANSRYYHKYNIYLVETGKNVDINNAKYLKTIMFLEGNYVMHVYVEEIEEGKYDDDKYTNIEGGKM